MTLPDRNNGISLIGTLSKIKNNLKDNKGKVSRNRRKIKGQLKNSLNFKIEIFLDLSYRTKISLALNGQKIYYNVEVFEDHLEIVADIVYKINDSKRDSKSEEKRKETAIVKGKLAELA